MSRLSAIDELNGHARPGDYAQAYRAAGLSPIPIRADGSKAPEGPWKRFQTEPASESELATKFLASNIGVGICYGAGSRGAELIDVDDEASYQPFADEVERAAPGLLAKLCIIKTPRPGRHVVYRCEHIDGNQKLAMRHATPEELQAKPSERVKCKIETRGQGGYALAPGGDPAAHPTGRPYVHLAGPDLTKLATITADEREVLFRAARLLNEVVEQEPAEVHHGQQAGGYAGMPPGDDFNLRASWDEILAPHGWTRSHAAGDVQHWTRPGKDQGTSATTGLTSKRGTDLLCVFSTSAHPFPGANGSPCSTHTKFGAYCLLNHGGDFATAARQLAAEGYGDAAQRQGMSNLLPDSVRDFGEIPGPPARRQPLTPIEKFSYLDLRSAYPAMKPPVVDGLLRRGETMNVVSYSKVGKSWLAYSLLLSIATGKSWLGTYPTTQGGVLLIDNELHRPTLANRIGMVAERLDCELEHYATQLDVWPLRGNLRSLEDMMAEFDAIEPGQYQLIAFDARYRFAIAGESENDNAAQAMFYNTLDRIAERTEAAIVLVHHTTKGNQTDKRVTDVGAGGGSQSRAADTHLVLREHEEEGCVVLDAALRSFAPVDPIVLQWEFPCWWPAEGLDPGELKGRKSRQQEARNDQDRKDKLAIVAAMQKASDRVTNKLLRKATGMGREKLARLLDALESEGQIKSETTLKRGNPCDEYYLPNDSES
ncbi:Regulatory protein RepA [Posidoniimonas polymericola]|uniref:Regulatory protein RepA n=1 Tax=Posidoniimonas polymericola TaxID=2528002 RepID=A0A5C5YL35_9BACT|nr:AAA family ATPase [Posidoniimonas polymericola]TWT75509.1 Regulatory protein RepA [Posidoniimonas polymericola]